MSTHEICLVSIYLISWLSTCVVLWRLGTAANRLRWSVQHLSKLMVVNCLQQEDRTSIMQKVLERNPRFLAEIDDA